MQKKKKNQAHAGVEPPTPLASLRHTTVIVTLTRGIAHCATRTCCLSHPTNTSYPYLHLFIRFLCSNKPTCANPVSFTHWNTDNYRRSRSYHRRFLAHFAKLVYYIVYLSLTCLRCIQSPYQCVTALLTVSTLSYRPRYAHIYRVVCLTTAPCTAGYTRSQNTGAFEYSHLSIYNRGVFVTK